MLLSVIRYLGGYLRIRIIGYSPERFLNLCSRHRIYLWGLTPYMHDYDMFVSVKDFRRLKPIIKKTKTKVVIIHRYGLPFFLHKYRKRKVFFAGAFGCFLFVCFMSMFVWNIHIEGNYSQTDETILEYLESQNVRHGMKKSEIDCPRIVRDLRRTFDDIIWVSVSIEGTRLRIRIKENSDTIRETAATEEITTDLVAAQDGEIVKIITRSGVPHVSVGDKVKKGDLLVSGRVALRDDSGEVTEYRYPSADADISIRVKETYEHILPIHYARKLYSKKRRVLFFLKTKSYCLTLGISRNPFRASEILTSEQQLQMGEHYKFPIFYGKKVITEYRLKDETRRKEEIQKILSEEFAAFCRDLEKKGVEIIEKDVKIYNGQKNAAAKGSLILQKPAYTKKETEHLQIEQNTKKE